MADFVPNYQVEKGFNQLEKMIIVGGFTLMLILISCVFIFRGSIKNAVAKDNKTKVTATVDPQESFKKEEAKLKAEEAKYPAYIEIKDNNVGVAKVYLKLKELRKIKDFSIIVSITKSLKNVKITPNSQYNLYISTYSADKPIVISNKETLNLNQTEIELATITYDKTTSGQFIVNPGQTISFIRDDKENNIIHKTTRIFNIGKVVPTTTNTDSSSSVRGE